MIKPDRLTAELALHKSDPEAWAAYIWLRNAMTQEKKKVVWDVLAEHQREAIRALADLV